MNDAVPIAPKKHKLRAGLYSSADCEGNEYLIKRNPLYKDWDVRDVKRGYLHARDDSLKDALAEIAKWGDQKYR